MENLTNEEIQKAIWCFADLIGKQTKILNSLIDKVYLIDSELGKMKARE